MKKILVLGQPFARILLKDALDAEYLVLEAASGNEAVDIARRHQPDLILLDMEMPGDGGPEICAQLKDADATRYVPLIILSSYEQREDIINGLHAGAEDYMTKPVDTNELLARVDAHMRTKNYYADLDKPDLLMLLELTEIISVTRNPRKILKIIVEKVVEAIDVSRCSIISINDDGDLIVKASSDLPENKEIKLDLAKYPEIEKALITQRPVVLQDIGSDPLMEPVREYLMGLKDKAIIVVPIIKKQNVIGTFFLRTSSILPGGITERILKLCQLVANISGNALENAMLFEAMQSAKRLLEDLAHRDSLTKLYNHQHFHTQFEVEFSRARRYSLPLSCLFIDIDNFKKINDRFGHISGDVVLKQLGHQINLLLRKSDVAARYGGEEFAVLLPNTTNEGANEFAGRLLTMIRELSVQQIRGEQITASIGIATFHSENHHTRDLIAYGDLLQLADRAMYEAKQAGKNRICRSACAV